MKSPSIYIELLLNVLADAHCGPSGRSSDLSRDVSYVSRRYDSEGLQFLTTTLPTLGKALIESLETGLFVLPQGFKPRSRKSQIPAFGQVFFKRLFSDDGLLLDDPDPYSVQELIQILMMFYKIDVPYSDEQCSRVIEKFVTTDAELDRLDLSKAPSEILLEAQRFLARLFKRFDPREIVPRHGPGAVASGEKLNEKWTFKVHYHRIHEKYPYYDYFVANRTEELLDRVKWYRNLKREISGCTKVVLVPKDSRGPRLISSEPLEYMYLQQGLGREITRLCESHPLTRGFVNFTDQSINGRYAFESSMDRRYATLDLEEASDRVSVKLVEALFPPWITPYLLALRSTHTQLPNKEVMALNKFAPMGSALCFPVMSLTLYAISKACVKFHGNGCDDVLVYGDDLVVPSTIAETLMGLLPAFGLRANSKKSFFRGYFRESCGSDAFRGVAVNPLRVRKPWSGSPKDAAAFASYWALSQAMLDRGFWRSSKFLQDQVETMYGKVPYGTSTSGYICRPVSAVNAERLNVSSRLRRRWRADLQRWEFRCRSIGSPGIKSPLSGWPRLLKALTSPSLGDPQLGVESRSTKIRTGWWPV
jgi:hypothetical protein